MTRRQVGRRPVLTPEQARQVREWAAFGVNYASVARRLGVSRNAVINYARGAHKSEGYA